MSTTAIRGEHPTHGTLWAQVDPGTREPPEKAAVAHSKFAAHLSPFASEAAAREALAAAGARVIEEQAATAKRGRRA